MPPPVREHRSAEREVEGLNPGRTNNQGLKKTGEIMLAVILDLVSVKMISSLARWR